VFVCENIDLGMDGWIWAKFKVVNHYWQYIFLVLIWWSGLLFFMKLQSGLRNMH